MATGLYTRSITGTTAGPVTPEDYSLLAAARSFLRDPSLGISADEADRERRISRDLEGIQPREVKDRGGLLLPPQALVPIRAANTGSLSTGGALVGSRAVLAEAVAAETCLGQLGARFAQVTGGPERSLVTLPAKATAFWVAEGVGPVQTWESDLVDSVTDLGYSDVCSRVDVTRRLLRQAPGVEDELRRLLRAGLAESIESGVIAGTGGTEPVGLADDRSGVSAATWSGAVPTALEAAQAVQGIATGGGVTPQLVSWLLSAEDYAALVNGGIAKEILPAVFTVAGRPALFTNFLPQGTAIVGDFSQIYVTLFGSTALLVNPYLDDFQVSRISTFQAVGTAVARTDLLRLYRAGQ